ncbi:hypothetical protein [Allonocardiopsis opalescens]|uniref:Uncharacterized protein n=1 Tax=Allonocardiopsis opalescens TaxID=1144618 RepID=A0A2T0Q243_9ACTN|nr:hypothetical protein [Allonocardiopsis opalescens]PRX97864.1 hypothetical protein CLV72_105214 [Allonocardiopsis opalescens]
MATDVTTAAVRSDDLATIGDIVLAGRPSGYERLCPCPAAARPTYGLLAEAAERAAAALSGAGELGTGHPVVLRGDGWEVRALVVPSDQVVAVPPGALRIVSGRGHLIASSLDGRLLDIRAAARGRTRVLGSGRRHELLNAGAEPAVAVYARSR